MALDPTSQVTVGGALLVVIYMLLKFKPWEKKDGNSKKNSSGEKEPSYWTGEFGRVIEEKMKAHDAARNEDIRRIFREELESDRRNRA